jgi:FdhE protein
MTMTGTIEQIIQEKPHLADPFRFYQKDLQFIATVRELPVSVAAQDICYPPEIVPAVFDRFQSLLDLPEGTLSPLKQAMEVKQIDFTRLPFNEVPAFSLPYAEEDLAMMLALLSRPWFLALADACRMAGRSWDEGRCPVCNAQPVLCWTGEGRRQTSCSFCSTGGSVTGTGCPVCHAAGKQEMLRFEKEDLFMVNTCGACRSYVKLVDPAVLSRWSPEIADLVSLPLDMIVQEKGFQRRAPNPIGLRIMR